MWQTDIRWDNKCELQKMFAIDTYVISLLDSCDTQFDKVTDLTQRYQIISKLATFSQLSQYDIMVSTNCIDIETIVIKFLDRSNTQLLNMATLTLNHIKF